MYFSKTLHRDVTAYKRLIYEDSIVYGNRKFKYEDLNFSLKLKRKVEKSSVVIRV